VGAKVAGQDETALPFGERRIQMFSAADSEHSLGSPIGYAVQKHIASAPENLVASELFADDGNIPVAIKRLPCLADSLVKRRAQIPQQPVLELTKA
jgi:hypothetical protein